MMRRLRQKDRMCCFENADAEHILRHSIPKASKAKLTRGLQPEARNYYSELQHKHATLLTVIFRSLRSLGYARKYNDVCEHNSPKSLSGAVRKGINL